MLVTLYKPILTYCNFICYGKSGARKSCTEGQ